MASVKTPQTQEMTPDVALRQMTTGTMVTQALYVAAKLGVADQLKDGPKSCAEMAPSVGASAQALYRVLRALASLGVFAEVGGGRFALTPMAELLRSDAPNSIRGWAIMRGEPFVYNPWGAILHSVRTGEPAFDHVFGMGAFDYFQKHPEVSGQFNEAMRSITEQTTQAITAAYDFSGIKTLVDVGGGTGALAATILKAHPAMLGIVAELPHLEAEMRRYVASAGVDRRCAFVAADFFNEVPTGGDAYVLKHILHDWSDELALKILQNCRKAITAGGKLLVIESVIPPGNEPHMGKFADLEMLVMTPGGRERSEEEFARLFEKAGFRLTRVAPTQSWNSVVEGKPV